MVELIWDGKYDGRGRRVAPSRLRLPFQTVETVNESAELRQRSLFGGPRETGWRNRLIWGDKKYVLPALLDEFAGQVDLIYIDPPFATGADFSFQIEIEGQGFTKEPSIIEQKAYRDTWGRGYAGYLQWVYETSNLLYELLSEKGSLYLHCEPTVSHYIKLVLDEIFGQNQFANEITWKRTGSHGGAKRYGPIHDTILFYTKGTSFTWNGIHTEYSEEYKLRFSYTDPDGRRFQPISLIAAGTRRGSTGLPWRGIDVTSKANHWRYTIEKLDELDLEGRIFWPGGDSLPRLKHYLDESEGSPVQDIWLDIPAVNSQAVERAGYPTQKPEALLERIIQASSNEGDLVLDCFSGSGTTAAVAERLGRRWIAADLGRFAVHTTRKRLLSMADVRPFVVQNLGKYERQAWQTAEFGLGPEGAVRAAEINKAYRRFILDLYGARPMEGYSWLHGAKAGRLVHVGPVDSPISPGDVTQIALEFRKAMGRGTDAPTTAGVDVLGWDFAFELNEVARQQAEAAKLDVRFVRIPREVLEKKAVEQGDIRFFELAALSVEVAQAKRDVTVKLTDFVIPPDDVPADVQAAISHWAQWIDYWAVDWDNNGDTFHNMWQAYRTRGKKRGAAEGLPLHTTHRYAEAGEYTIMVKVIDILGNDTTKTVRVVVA